MFEPLAIIYASPLILKVAYTVSALASIALAITFLCIATEAPDGQEIEDRE